jgi:predicted nuclease with TOPRIM domain
MRDIDHYSFNRANKDIWGLLNEAVKTKNWALIQSNIDRLYAMQDFLIKKVNLMESQINTLKNDVATVQMENDRLEREWLQELTKRNGIYENLKERVGQTFRS